MSQTLKIVLLTVKPGLRIFHSEMEETEEPEIQHKGLRGWAERRLRRMKTGLRESQGLAARTTRRILNWLHRWSHPDEALLSRLRSVETVDVEHPPSMTDIEARNAWNAFLAQARRRHGPWFLVNLMISPLTVVLAPLPGPNLIGYWFAFRAWQDGMILLGIRKAKIGEIETTFLPNESLEIHRPDPRRRTSEQPDGASRVA